MTKRICLASALGLALAGCGGGGGGSGTAFVLGVNACPNVGSLSISANGSTVLSNAAFLANSSAFVGVNSGTNATLFLTNTNSSQLASGTTTFVNKDYYTAYALGNSVNQFIFVYPTDVSAPTAGFGRLMFVNASTLQPSVDVYVTASGGVQGAPMITSMTPFNSGKVNPTPLAAGLYDVQFKIAGTSTVVVDNPAVTIGSNTLTNEILIVGMTDAATGAATPQVALPVLSVPVVATAPKARNLGHPIIVGHPGMTAFPK